MCVAGASALVIFVTELSTKASDSDSPPPVSISGASTGRIALVYGGTVPKFDLQVPDTKEEVAGDTARMLSLDWLRFAREHGILCELDGRRVQLGMALTFPAWIAGEIHGGIVGKPAKKVDATSLVLGNAMNELQVEEALRWQLMYLVWEKNQQAVTILTNSFPVESEFRMPTIMDIYAPIPLSKRVAPPHATLCANLSAQGFDRMMMVRVINYGLSGKDGHDSDLSVNMTVRVTFIQLSDATQGDTFYAEHTSLERKFFVWAENNGELFREEFRRGVQNVAEQISSRVPATAPAPGVSVEIAQVSGK